jgi:hypothetical protein
MNKKFVYQVGNNKKVILWCTVNQIYILKKSLHVCKCLGLSSGNLCPSAGQSVCNLQRTKVTLRQVVFEYFGSPLLATSNIHSILQALLHITITVMRRRNGAKISKVQCIYVSDILVYKSQQDAQVTEFILSDNCCTCFGRHYQPSSGAQNNCNYSFW